MTVLAKDLFYNSTSIDLKSHTSDSGNTWAVASFAPSTAGSLSVSSNSIAAGTGSGLTPYLLQGFAPASADYTTTISLDISSNSVYSWPQFLFRYSSTADTGYRFEMSSSAFTLYRYNAGVKTSLTNIARSGVINTLYAITIQVVGNVITFYTVSGGVATKQFSYTDTAGIVPTTTPGTIGLLACTGASYSAMTVEDKFFSSTKTTLVDTATVAGVGSAKKLATATAAGVATPVGAGTIVNTGTNYLTDNFVSSTAGDLNTHQPNNGGLWVNTGLTNDPMNITTSGYAVDADTGSSNYTYYVNRTTPVADSTTSLNFKVASTGSYIGVIFRHLESAKTGYVVWISGTIITLSRYTAGTSGSPSTTITTGTVPALVVGNTYNLSVTAIGSAITVFVNGVSYISTTDTTYSNAGLPGIFSYNAGNQITNMTVTNPVAMGKGAANGAATVTGAGVAIKVGRATAAGVATTSVLATVANNSSSELTDLFNTTAAVALTAHYPDNGGVWVSTGHTSGVMNVATAGYVTTTASGAAYYFNRTSPLADSSVSFNFVYKGSGYAGVLLRYSESTRTGYVVYVLDGTVYLAKLTATVTTTPVVITSATIPTWANQTATHNLTATITGSTINVFVDGINYLSTTDTTYTNAGVPGLYLYGANGYFANDITATIAVTSAVGATAGSATVAATGAENIAARGAATGTATATGAARLLRGGVGSATGQASSTVYGASIQGNLFVKDSFTSGSTVTIDQHAPEVGGQWYSTTALGGGVTIYDNSTGYAAPSTTSSSFAVYLNRSTAPSGAVQITFDGAVTTASDSTGVCFCVDPVANNGYALFITTTSVYLLEYVAGTQNVLASVSVSGAAPIYPTTANFEVDVLNGAVTVYRNGAQIISYTDTTPPAGLAVGMFSRGHGVVDNFTAQHTANPPINTVGVSPGVATVAGAGGRIVALTGTAAGTASTSWVPAVTKPATFSTGGTGTVAAKGLVLLTGYFEPGGQASAQAVSVPITINPTTATATGKATVSAHGSGRILATGSATGSASSSVIGRRFGQGEGDFAASGKATTSVAGVAVKKVVGAGSAAGKVAIEGRSDKLGIGVASATGVSTPAANGSSAVPGKATGISTAAANSLVNAAAKGSAAGSATANGDGYPRAVAAHFATTAVSTATGSGDTKEKMSIGRAAGKATGRVFNGPIVIASFGVTNTATSNVVGTQIEHSQGTAAGSSTAQATEYAVATFNVVCASDAHADEELIAGEGVGEADGLSDVEGVGVAIGVGVGAADGLSDVDAIGIAIATGIFHEDCVSNVEAIGSAIATAAFAIFDHSDVEAVGRSTAAAAFALIDLSDAEAIGSAVLAGVFTVHCSAIAHAVGESFSRGDFHIQGTSTAQAIGGSIDASIFGVNGAATVSGIGGSIDASTAAASGISAVNGVGVAIISFTSAIAGTSTAQAVGSEIASTVFHSNGYSIIEGVGSSTASSVFDDAGMATVHGVGSEIAEAVFGANGTSIAQAEGRSIFTSTAVAVGTSTAQAVGEGINAAVFGVHGISTAQAIGRATTTSRFDVDGEGDATGYSSRVPPAPASRRQLLPGASRITKPDGGSRVYVADADDRKYAPGAEDRKYKATAASRVVVLTKVKT